MRMFLVVVMALHGFAHLPGVLASWRVATFDEMPYRTTLFGGAVNVGDAGMGVMGALWLAAAVAFVSAAAGAFAMRPWWPQTALGACALSLLLCVATLPYARLGIPFDLAIAGALLFAPRIVDGMRIT